MFKKITVPKNLYSSFFLLFINIISIVGVFIAISLSDNQVALANQEKALITYKSKILNASKEVSDALYTYDAAVKKADYKQKEYTLYNQAISNSEELLNYGMANYLEVITARDNGLNAELNVVNAKLSSLTSMVELYRAVGGGWQ